jgi:hypothetical protein
MPNSLVIGKKRKAIWYYFTIINEELVLNNFMIIFVTENSNEYLSLERRRQDFRRDSIQYSSTDKDIRCNKLMTTSSEANLPTQLNIAFNERRNDP